MHKSINKKIVIGKLESTTFKGIEALVFYLDAKYVNVTIYENGKKTLDKLMRREDYKVISEGLDLILLDVQEITIPLVTSKKIMELYN
jgi:hypothetical protein